jgi:hypothetical protein
MLFASLIVRYREVFNTLISKAAEIVLAREVTVAFKSFSDLLYTLPIDITVKTNVALETVAAIRVLFKPDALSLLAIPLMALIIVITLLTSVPGAGSRAPLRLAAI